MDLNEFISVTEFCKSHGIQSTFVIELKEYGLVELVQRKNIMYIPLYELPKTEKILRLHSELDINLEGIEVITQLLNRIQQMQDEMIRLKNKLGLYE
ncbi:MAG: chaperone modulator CbpM [Flavobacteriaceae bacterium]